jgi:hypothetical protein
MHGAITTFTATFHPGTPPCCRRNDLHGKRPKNTVPAAVHRTARKPSIQPILAQPPRLRWSNGLYGPKNSQGTKPPRVGWTTHASRLPQGRQQLQSRPVVSAEFPPPLPLAFPDGSGTCRQGKSPLAQTRQSVAKRPGTDAQLFSRLETTTGSRYRGGNGLAFMNITDVLQGPIP